MDQNSVPSKALCSSFFQVFHTSRSSTIYYWPIPTLETQTGNCIRPSSYHLCFLSFALALIIPVSDFLFLAPNNYLQTIMYAESADKERSHEVSFSLRYEIDAS